MIEGRRTNRRRLVLGASGVGVGAGLFGAGPAAGRRGLTAGRTEAFQPDSSEIDEAAIDETLARLTIAEKVGQLFMVPAEGTGLTPAFAERLATERPGGVILLAPNVGAPDEVAAFVAAIHDATPALPPLVAVDQEGGLVARLGGDPAPAAPELGLAAAADVAALAAARAAFVAGYGFDVNFAPVADVAFAPDSFMAGRTFGSDPEAVAAAVAAYLAGAAGSGVLHCAKHFPGHGRASVDSHLALPVVDISLAEWRATDALPFRAAVEAGVPMVMLGHLAYPQWDEAPTSLSPVAVGVLRQELGFEGVVVTDDLGMDALAAYDPFEVVDRAVAAGVDLLLYVTPAVPPADLIGHLLARVERSEVSEARIDASLRRLLRARRETTLAWG